MCFWKDFTLLAGISFRRGPNIYQRSPFLSLKRCQTFKTTDKIKILKTFKNRWETIMGVRWVLPCYRNTDCIFSWKILERIVGEVPKKKIRTGILQGIHKKKPKKFWRKSQKLKGGRFPENKTLQKPYMKSWRICQKNPGWNRHRNTWKDFLGQYMEDLEESLEESLEEIKKE